MSFALLCAIAQGAWAQTTYNYYECSWDEDTKQVVRTQRTTSGNIDDISDAKYSSGGDLHANTYSYFVATRNVTIPNGLTTDGNVKLILLDGVTLTVGGNGLTVPDGSSLTIYAQSYGEGSNPGKLIARSDNDDNAGIGSKKRTNPGDITIHGGYIEAHGGDNGAGIGGGLEANGPNHIIIYDGTVKANGGKNGAGIGGGAQGYARDVYIYGGDITAQGGSRGAGIGGGYFAEGTKYAFDGLYFHGNARVEARGGVYAAGIGGGQSGDGAYVTVDGDGVHIDAYGGTDAAGIGSGEKTAYGDDIDSGKLTVNSGYVYANGNGWGAGIGGGEDAKGAEVVINGGTVKALAGNDAGDKNGSAIGSEDGDGRRGSLSIADKMMVHAGTFGGSNPLFSYGERVPACYFRRYTQIEVCNHEGKTYTINGTGADGKHKLNCSHCLLRTESTHTFDNGTCTVCGVSSSTSTVSIYLPEKDGESYTDGHYTSSPRTQTLITNSTISLPAPPITHLPNGVEFAGWAVGTPTGLGITSYWKGENESIITAGSSYKVSADVSLTARYKGVSITLADATDNGETLYQNNGKTAQTVTLSGRTLWKDGAWNTLCLPFDYTADQIANNTNLAGAQLMTLEESSFDAKTGQLTINFKTANSITAGVPYIVKWTSGSNVSNPSFTGVVINNTPATTSTDCVDFVGIFSPEFLVNQNGTLRNDETNEGGTNTTEDNTQTEARTKLYLGGDNTLYYPESVDFKVNAFRAYFKLKNGLTASPNPSNPSTNSVRSFSLNFNSNVTTGITTTNSTNDTNSDGAWFSIDGRRLTGKPTAPGLYIHSTSGRLQGKNHGKKVIIK